MILSSTTTSWNNRWQQPAVKSLVVFHVTNWNKHNQSSNLKTAFFPFYLFCTGWLWTLLARLSMLSWSFKALCSTVSPSRRLVFGADSFLIQSKSQDPGLYSLSFDWLLQPLIFRQSITKKSTTLNQQLSQCRPGAGKLWVQCPARLNQTLLNCMDSVFRLGLDGLDQPKIPECNTTADHRSLMGRWRTNFTYFRIVTVSETLTFKVPVWVAEQLYCGS